MIDQTSIEAITEPLSQEARACQSSFSFNLHTGQINPGTLMA